MNTVKINQCQKPTIVDLITGTKYKLLSYTQTANHPNSYPYMDVEPAHVQVVMSMMRHDNVQFSVTYVKSDKPKFKIILPSEDLFL